MMVRVIDALVVVGRAVFVSRSVEIEPVGVIELAKPGRMDQLAEHHDLSEAELLVDSFGYRTALSRE